jgi:hypothetical protein
MARFISTRKLEIFNEIIAKSGDDKISFIAALEISP